MEFKHSSTYFFWHSRGGWVSLAGLRACFHKRPSTQLGSASWFQSWWPQFSNTATGDFFFFNAKELWKHQRTTTVRAERTEKKCWKFVHPHGCDGPRAQWARGGRRAQLGRWMTAAGQPRQCLKTRMLTVSVLWHQATFVLGPFAPSAACIFSDCLPPCKACILHPWSWLWSPPAGRWCQSHTTWCCLVGPLECWKVWCLQSETRWYWATDWSYNLADDSKLRNLPLWIIFKFSFKWFSALTVCWGHSGKKGYFCFRNHEIKLKEKSKVLTANVIFPNISSGMTSSNTQYTYL